LQTMKQMIVFALCSLEPGLKTRGRMRQFCLACALLLLPIAGKAQGVAVETSTVRYQVANPEPKGTLVDQIKRAKEMIKGRVFKYRVFVRWDTDTGLISTILRAPVLSIIRVAALPVINQKISVEAISDGGSNPQGLIFVSGQGVSEDENVPLVEPLVDGALKNIDTALRGAGTTVENVVAVTCYLSSTTDFEAVQKLAAARYPRAAINHLQIPIPYGRALVECEAVARAGSQQIGFVSPDGLTKSANFSQVTGVHTPRVVFSALYGAKPCTAAAVRSMFQSLASGLKKNGASIQDVAFSYLYPNSVDGTDLTRSVRFEFYSKEKPPASTLVPFSGFSDKDVCTGVEVVAPVRK